MTGTAVFATSEALVATVAIVTIVSGVRLLGRYRLAATATILGAIGFVAAEALHWLQEDVVIHALRDESHKSLRLVVGILGDTLYFGIGGLGILLLFFAVVADRAEVTDRKREPVELARHIVSVAWRFYQDRSRR